MALRNHPYLDRPLRSEAEVFGRDAQPNIVHRGKPLERARSRALAEADFLAGQIRLVLRSGKRREQRSWILLAFANRRKALATAREYGLLIAQRDAMPLAAE